MVLSINGREDARNVYAGYFQGSQGMFAEAADERLPSMAPVFAFRHDEAAYAIPIENVEGGRAFLLNDGTRVLLCRKRGASMFQSTEAFVSSSGFERRDDVWVELRTAARFDPVSGSFDDDSIRLFMGFDTFWYTWSLANPDTRLLH